jgi:hypothetical protein
MEKIKDFLSNIFVIPYAYFFIIWPTANGISNAPDNRTTMSRMGIENWVLNSRYTKAGKINGTASDVVNISPTIIGNLLPTKFATNGDPRPVETPDNKNIANMVSTEGFGYTI